MRALLDKALNDEDAYDDLVSRFLKDFKETEDLTESAKNILMGHPLVKSMSFPNRWEISFDTLDPSGAPLAIIVDGIRGKVRYLRNGAEISPDDIMPF